MRHPFVHSAVATALLLFPGCASRAPPSGGPPDRTPPRVLSTVPADDSVAVGTDTTIEIRFSESMDRPSVERSIFLSPRSAEAPSFDWDGNRLRISPDDPLARDRTYTVSVGAESRDVHRNRMAASYDFTFSTGVTIHRGSVSGRVSGAGRVAVVVAAYDLDVSPPPDPALPAPFVTQSGDGGGFSFPGLSPGRYRVFAFEDDDGDQRHDAGVERLAVPPEDAAVPEAASRVVLKRLKLASRDTVPPRVTAARTLDARHVRLKFDEAVQLPVDVRMTADGGRLLETPATHHGATDSSEVFVVTAPQTEGAAYRLIVAARDARGNAMADTTLTVKGDGRQDSRPPAVVSAKPSGVVRRSATIRLTFTEAMAQDTGPLWAASDSTLSPEGKATWRTANVLTFTPASLLPEGAVRLLAKPGRLRDVAGNAVEQPVEVAFETAGAAGLGSVSGTAAEQSVPVVLRIVRIGGEDGGDPDTMRIAPGDTTFTIEGLVAGSYALSGYLDSDDDGAWFPGHPAPFEPAEPVLSRTDTVDVRPRWETVIERRLTDAVADTAAGTMEESP